MYVKGIEKWQKRPPQDWQKWAKFSSHVIEDYERQLTEMVVTAMGQKGCNTAMHATEDLAEVDLLTDSVTKYTEIATQA